MSINIKASAVAKTIPYDNSISLLSAVNVQAAIDRLLQITDDITFSFKFIHSTKIVEIPIYREMLVNNYIDIDGTLNIEGDLSIV